MSNPATYYDQKRFYTASAKSCPSQKTAVGQELPVAIGDFRIEVVNRLSISRILPSQISNAGEKNSGIPIGPQTDHAASGWCSRHELLHLCSR